MINLPKYKIGDVVVYRDREEEDIYHQSKIIISTGFIEDLKTEPTEWYYATENTDERMEDDLSEEDIIAKL